VRDGCSALCSAEIAGQLREAMQVEDRSVADALGMEHWSSEDAPIPSPRPQLTPSTTSEHSAVSDSPSTHGQRVIHKNPDTSNDDANCACQKDQKQARY
jgi:hypothetical protein